MWDWTTIKYHIRSRSTKWLKKTQLNNIPTHGRAQVSESQGVYTFYQMDVHDVRVLQWEKSNDHKFLEHFKQRKHSGKHFWWKKANI